MSTQPDDAPKKSNAYEMFILVLTVLSLVVMVAMLLPLKLAGSTLDEERSRPCSRG